MVGEVPYIHKAPPTAPGPLNWRAVALPKCRLAVFFGLARRLTGRGTFLPKWPKPPTWHNMPFGGVAVRHLWGPGAVGGTL